MSSIIARFIFLLGVLGFSSLGLATPHSSGFGLVADNLMDPVTVVSSLISAASLILGVTFVFAAIIRYSQHRMNPLATPLSTVVYLFILGIVLLVLPLMYKLTSSGVHL